MSQDTVPGARPEALQKIFCNRTLNLRTLRAIGYDMDYTLIHYHVDEWERCAFEHLRLKLLERGWPVGALVFDPRAILRGLLVDIQEGNIVEANRFGFVKSACHGMRRLDYAEHRKLYSRVEVNPADPRWNFLNTFFSVSEGSMYRQLVDLLDDGQLPGVRSYEDLYKQVRSSLDQAHMEGQLKADIIGDPDRFVELDPNTPLALLDQKMSGKKIVLITNSEWPYTQAMMTYAFDRFLPDAMTWRDLFDLIIVAARKPDFFDSRLPCFEVVDEQGLLKPNVGKLKPGRIYHGGHAGMVEACLGVSGHHILYVGDHVYGDVQVSKSLLRWRTALVVRELEGELQAIEDFKQDQATLAGMMIRKTDMERQLSELRLQIQRHERAYGPPPADPIEALRARFNSTRAVLVDLDRQIAPLAERASKVGNEEWGLLLRAGNDKSYMARQLERHADIYTSRVSNFLAETPFSYLRSPRGLLPHDQDR